jgi:hypothetical protein
VYDHDVYDHPAYPYVLVNRSRPVFDDRALTRAPHGRGVSWLLTPAGQSRVAVAGMCDTIIDLLEGARVAGQRLEYEPTGVDVEQDEGLTINGLAVFYSKLTFNLKLPT